MNCSNFFFFVFLLKSKNRNFMNTAGKGHTYSYHIHLRSRLWVPTTGYRHRMMNDILQKQILNYSHGLDALVSFSSFWAWHQCTFCPQLNILPETGNWWIQEYQTSNTSRLVSIWQPVDANSGSLMNTSFLDREWLRILQHHHSYGQAQVDVI